MESEWNPEPKIESAESAEAAESGRNVKRQLYFFKAHEPDQIDQI